MTVTGKELMNDDRMAELFPQSMREKLVAAGCSQPHIDAMKAYVGAAFLQGVVYGVENQIVRVGQMPEKASTDAGTDHAPTHTR